MLRDAGQANDAAVSYHFGSRAGLLRAIVDRHMRLMEAERTRTLAALADTELTELVRMVVVPTAARLRTPEGRDFLRITEQLASLSGVRAGRPALVIQDTALAEQLTRLEHLVARGLEPAPGPARARERVASLVTFLTASLAERARALEHRPRQPLGHRRYVDELVAMLAAAMSA